MGQTNPKYPAAPNEILKFKFTVRGNAQPIQVAFERGVTYPKVDRKEWEVVLAQMQVPMEKKNRMLLLPDDFKYQIVYQFKKTVSAKVEPPIISSEQGLEDLLLYIRQLTSEELNQYVQAKDLIESLSRLCQSDCEGYHDKECLILNIILHCLQNNPYLEISQNTLHELCMVLNYMHTVNFCLIMEIFSIICCHQSDDKTHRIALSFMEMKLTSYWAFPLEPFILLLQRNRSVFAIGALCKFINYFSEVHSESEYRNKIKTNFIKYGILVIYKDILDKIQDKHFKIQDCTYEAMDVMLWEQFNGQEQRKRKLLPPDGNPVELTTCSKLCHELFVDLKDPNAQTLFDEQCQLVQRQIDAFLEITNEVKQTLDNASNQSGGKFKRQTSISNMFDDCDSQTIKIPNLDYQEINGKIRESLSIEESVKILDDFVMQTAQVGLNPITQIIQVAAKKILDLKKVDPVNQSLEQSLEKIASLETQLRKIYHDKDQLQQQINQLKDELSKVAANPANPQPQSQSQPQQIQQPPPPPNNAPPPPPPPNNAPPPPPPPGGRGPPPPPPPGGRGPPPPPGAKPVVVASKPKCTPSKPMKQVPWVLVKEDKIKQTIWEGLDDSKVKVDIELLEDKFGRPEPSAIAKSQVVKVRPQKISLLSPDRQKNVELVISRLKISSLTLKEALLSIDYNVLDEDKLSMIMNAVPEKEEQEQFVNYTPEDITNVAAPDLFFMDVASVPQIKIRVEAVQIKYEWVYFIEGLESKQVKIRRGIDMHRQDVKLRTLLQYSLAYGNYLNGQSARGGASAFKMDIMSQLDDVKSNDQKSNLLIVIIEQIEKENNGQPLYDPDWIAQVDYEFLCKIAVNQISQDTGEIKRMMRVVEKAMRSQGDDQNDKAEIKFKELYEQIEQKCNDVEKTTSQLESDYKLLLGYFCEDIKTPSDEFFSKIERIWTDYKNAKAQILRVQQSQKKEIEQSMKQTKAIQQSIPGPLPKIQEEEVHNPMVESVIVQAPVSAPTPLKKQQTKDVLAELRMLQAKKLELANKKKLEQEQLQQQQ